MSVPLADADLQEAYFVERTEAPGALGRELGWRDAGSIIAITVAVALAVGAVAARLPVWG